MLIGQLDYGFIIYKAFKSVAIGKVNISIEYVIIVRTLIYRNLRDQVVDRGMVSCIRDQLRSTCQ